VFVPGRGLLAGASGQATAAVSTCGFPSSSAWILPVS